MKEPEITLEDKILLAQIRIRQWHEHWESQISVSFSGGLDSTVLLHLVREIFPETVAMFADTGLEFPEIRDFVKTIDNVIWVNPCMPFKDVIQNYGYPVISKNVSRKIRVLRENKPTTKNTRHLYTTGYRKDGGYNYKSKLPDKHRKLLFAPFKISEQCCHKLKVKPLNDCARQHNLKPLIGIRADEGGTRGQHRDKDCNRYNGNHPASTPLIRWTDTDIQDYIKINRLPYSKIYDMGEKRTGCMFCMFGVHLETGQNRFQRMAVTHPRHYKTCMEKLGLREVLTYINVNPDPIIQPKGFFDEKEI